MEKLKKSIRENKGALLLGILIGGVIALRFEQSEREKGINAAIDELYILNQDLSDAFDDSNRYIHGKLDELRSQ